MAALLSIWDFSFLTRGQTCAPWSGNRVLTIGLPGKSLKGLKKTLRYNLYNVKFCTFKCTLQWFLGHSLHCATTTTLQNVSIPFPQIKPIPISRQSQFLPSSPWQPLNYLCLYGFAFSDVSHKWNIPYVACCVFFLSLGGMFSRFTYDVVCVRISLFSWLTDILLCHYTTFCLSIMSWRIIVLEHLYMCFFLRHFKYF